MRKWQWKQQAVFWVKKTEARIVVSSKGVCRQKSTEHAFSWDLIHLNHTTDDQLILAHLPLRLSVTVGAPQRHQGRSERGNTVTTQHCKLLFALTIGAPLSMISLFMVSVTCSQLWSQNIKWKIPEIKFLSFKLHGVLRSVMNSRDVRLCPAWDMNHSFCPASPHRMCSRPFSHLVATLLAIKSTVTALQYLCSGNLITQRWPKSTNAVMLAIQIFQGE